MRLSRWARSHAGAGGSLLCGLSRRDETGGIVGEAWPAAEPHDLTNGELMIFSMHAGGLARGAAVRWMNRGVPSVGNQHSTGALSSVLLSSPDDIASPTSSVRRGDARLRDRVP